MFGHFQAHSHTTSDSPMTAAALKKMLGRAGAGAGAAAPPPGGSGGSWCRWRSCCKEQGVAPSPLPAAAAAAVAAEGVASWAAPPSQPLAAPPWSPRRLASVPAGASCTSTSRSSSMASRLAWRTGGGSLDVLTHMQPTCNTVMEASGTAATRRCPEGAAGRAAGPHMPPPAASLRPRNSPEPAASRQLRAPSCKTTL